MAALGACVRARSTSQKAGLRLASQPTRALARLALGPRTRRPPPGAFCRLTGLWTPSKRGLDTP